MNTPKSLHLSLHVQHTRQEVPVEPGPSKIIGEFVVPPFEGRGDTWNLVTAQVSDETDQPMPGVPVEFGAFWVSPEKGKMHWGNLTPAQAITDLQGRAWAAFIAKSPTYVLPNPINIFAKVDGYSIEIPVQLTWHIDQDGHGKLQLRYLASSRDGVESSYYEYLPASYSSDRTYPLVVVLHNRSRISPHYPHYDELAFKFRPHADQMDLITVFARGRLLRDKTGYTYYYDSPRPGIRYGEQDILDLVQHVRAHHSIDPNRIYICGFGDGGAGALAISLRNPGIFAAAGCLSGPTDYFHYYKEFESRFCLGTHSATIAGGAPGSSAGADTRFHMLSPRFLLENAQHTPIYISHGEIDDVVPNHSEFGAYLHGHHIVDVSGFEDEHGRTPTLSELRAAFPVDYVFTARWHEKAAHTRTIHDVGEMLEFFLSHKLVVQPRVFHFKTYDDLHERAYWGRIHIRHPWTTQPGSLHAVSRPEPNEVTLFVDDLDQVTLDMDGMELQAEQPIVVRIQTERPARGEPFRLSLRGYYRVGTVTCDDTLFYREADYGLDQSGLHLRLKEMNPLQTVVIRPA